ncbi:MAG: response regulator transcription factor [Thermaurantimonas sp.]
MTDSSIKILIVDDEPAIILSLDFLIRKAGYIPFIARNGQEALDIVAAERPHIVVLDIMMPDVDGYEVCRRIKEDSATADTRIIFLSAKSKFDDIERGLALGADFYITKPFSNKHLMDKIRELAERIIIQTT